MLFFMTGFGFDGAPFAGTVLAAVFVLFLTLVCEIV
jgi:hypothetical protein